MAARSRGLGISKTDMEASRLVFVFVKDSKPRRKVAIPVLDSYSWDQFLDQVKAKLKLAGIADIYLSSNGHKVRSVSELQDIDELCVVEGADAAAANGSSVFAAAAAAQRSTAELPGMSVESAAQEAATLVLSPSMRQQSMQERHKIVVSADGMHSSGSASYATDEDANKYARRAHPLRRWLQRLAPNMFSPGLPVTARDAGQLDGSSDGSKSSSSSRRRRSRRAGFDLRNAVLLLATACCVMTMLYMFIRVSTSAAVGSLAAVPAGSQATSIDSAAAAAQQQGAAAVADSAGLAAGAAAAAAAAAGGGGSGGGAADAGGGGAIGPAAQAASGGGAAGAGGVP